MNLTLTGIRYGGYFQGMSVVGDAPVGIADDKLSFRRYIDPLIAVLTDVHQETPFTVGVFGPWGSGKSSLLRMLNDELRAQHSDSFVLVDFNAWVHRGETNVLIPLLHTLRDALHADPKQRFIASAEKIGNVLLNLGADLLLKAVTAGSVSLENLEKLEKQYLERRFAVESEMRNLRQTLKAEVDKVQAAGAKLVISVDDLDRCEPDQIVALLDSIKLFLDFKNVFVVLAVDREVIRRGIQVRYKDFKFAVGRDEVIGHEYLEKMVQLPVELFPLSQAQIEEFVEGALPGKQHQSVRDLVKAVALANARKIKRLVNIFAVVRAFMLADPQLKLLDHLTVLRLIAIQVQYPELYWEIVRLPRALEAMEKTYSGSHTADADYQVYAPLHEPILRLCKKYCQPDSPLGNVFKGSTFSAAKKQLPQYLSMLGGLGV